MTAPIRSTSLNIGLPRARWGSRSTGRRPTVGQAYRLHRLSSRRRPGQPRQELGGPEITEATAATGLDATTSTPVHLEVVQAGANFQVFVNGSHAAVLDWTDPAQTCFAGYVAIENDRSDATFWNFGYDAEAM